MPSGCALHRLGSRRHWFSCPLPNFLQLAVKVSPDFSVVRNKTKQIQNRQTDRSTRHKPGIHAQSSPRKRNNTSTSAFQSGVSPPFPPGSNRLFSLLAGSLSPDWRLMCRKTFFEEVDCVAISLSVCIPMPKYVREKVFSPKFELMLASKQPSTVVRPISQFRRHCFRGVSNPYQPMVVRADLTPGPSYPCCGSPYKHVQQTIFFNYAIEGCRVGLFQSAQQPHASQRGLSSP